MISRRTALALGEAYEQEFRCKRRRIGGRGYYDGVDSDRLYDFLFERDYSALFCDDARQCTSSLALSRDLKRFIMRIHTGQAVHWMDQDQRQQLLRNLAQDILNAWSNEKDSWLSNSFMKLRNSLELDGYVYRDSRLWAPEGGCTKDLF